MDGLEKRNEVALAAWQRRADEAVSKIELPEYPFRIRYVLHEDAFVCDEAQISKPGVPNDSFYVDSSGKRESLLQLRGHFAGDPKRYEDAVWWAAQTPTADWFWRPISPSFKKLRRARYWLLAHLDARRTEVEHYDSEGNKKAF